jgi:hypothetical protein
MILAECYLEHGTLFKSQIISEAGALGNSGNGEKDKPRAGIIETAPFSENGAVSQ